MSQVPADWLFIPVVFVVKREHSGSVLSLIFIRIPANNFIRNVTVVEKFYFVLT